MVAVTIGIDKNLEVVVVENHGIALGQRSPDVRFLELSSDKEVIVIPSHLHAGSKSRADAVVTLDVAKIVAPGNSLPTKIVQSSIHRNCGA